MTVIIVLIIVSIIVAGGFLVAFIWSVKSGQFDDAVTPSIRMLLDNSIESNHNKNKKDNNTKTIK